MGHVSIVDIDEEGGLALKLVDPEKINGIIVTNLFGNVVVNIKKYKE